MAKGTAMGLWRGKKGSSVFYKVKNSNNAQKQGIRERIYEVSNPKSYAQAGQRMKMLAVQRFFNQFKDVLERGFEGVKYGALSRQAFLKNALSLPLSSIPSVSKDDVVVPPGEYLVSRGSLCQCSPTTGGDNIRIFVPFFNDEEEIHGSATGEKWTEAMIGAYETLGGKRGDQITLLAVTYENDVFSYKAASSIVEVDNDFMSDITDWDVSLGNVDFKDAIAAAIIISRDGDTADSHLRSTSIMAVDKAALPEFFTNEARLVARRSYMNSNVLNNDWPADPEDTTDADGNVLGTVAIDIANPAGGTVAGAGSFPVGDVITLTATPGEGYSTEWYADEARTIQLGTGNTLQLSVGNGAVPPKPWTVKVATLLIDVLCAVVAWRLIGSEISGWRFELRDFLLSFWVLAVDAELHRGRTWIRGLVTLMACASFALLVNPSLWAWCAIVPLVGAAGLLRLPPSNKWYACAAAAEDIERLAWWRKVARVA
ncbi:MAG: InlB B-repeat-containing protein, partial [Prevotella sp.]